MKSIKLSRRQALVAAGLAGVTTLLAGSAFLVAGAQSGAGTIVRAGAASSDPAAVVTEVQYDDTYAIVGDSPDRSSGSSRPAAAPAASTAPSVAPTSVSTEHPADDPTTEPAADEPHEDGPKPAPTTTAPTPTTAPTVLLYPKDLPPGWEIPEDWPATKPLPPIPAGCKLGHLEDNGRWNCED